MESIQTANWSIQTDRGVVQLLDRQGDADARERSTRAYRGSARTAHVTQQPQPSSAPVSLELSGDAHPVQAFANFVEISADERVQVRLVDAVTTRTLGEITVGAALPNHSTLDDYGRLISRWGAYATTR
jgi:hypothetical protein